MPAGAGAFDQSSTTVVLLVLHIALRRSQVVSEPKGAPIAARPEVRIRPCQAWSAQSRPRPFCLP
jgi:hypothetical protein